MFNLKPDFKRIPNIKFAYNIGSLFDVPTGSYEIGSYGESILNGGLCNITGLAGIGNNFKSTIMHYMTLSAMSRFNNSTASTYDTEINISESHLKGLANNIYELNGEDVIDNSRWTITDKTMYHGNEWFEAIKSYMDSKISNSKTITVTTPFLDRDNKTNLTMLIPTFTEIDSLSKFETESTNDMQKDNELGDSSANTLYMKEGQVKKRLLSYLPKPIALSNNFFLMSAHMGKTIPMDPRAAPVKKLQFLKNGDTIKGTSDEFFYLTTNFWNCHNARPLLNDSTKGPEYPRDSSDNLKGDTDLFVVSVLNLRSKVGLTGVTLNLLISQTEGVLPSLSEFQYLKESQRFGIGGTLQNFHLDILPNVNLSRTTIRSKLKNDPKLRRAMNITSEMSQIYDHHKDLPKELKCTPKDLYDDLIKIGYDWDTLLNTRGWWTYNNDKHPVPFLSTMDLLKMRIGTYVPYWLPEEQKNKLKNVKDIKYETGGKDQSVTT